MRFFIKRLFKATTLLKISFAKTRDFMTHILFNLSKKITAERFIAFDKNSFFVSVVILHQIQCFSYRI